MSKKDEKGINHNKKKEEVGRESPGKSEIDRVSTENKVKEKKDLEEEIVNLKRDKLLLLAEIDNKQKEFKRQIEEVYKYSNKKFILGVLDFLIDLEERALKAMRSDPDKKVQNHLVGVEMMRNNLWKNLESEGVKEIVVKPESDTWNSYLHELVEKIEDEKLPEGTIKEIQEKGYLLYGQVLRPVKVKISKKNK